MWERIKYINGKKNKEPREKKEQTAKGKKEQRTKGKKEQRAKGKKYLVITVGCCNKADDSRVLSEN